MSQFLAEFITISERILASDMHNESVDKAIMQINDKFVIEMKKREQNALQKIAGYCVSQEVGLCDICDNFVQSKSAENILE